MKKTVFVPPIANSEITSRARASLKGYWGVSALILLAIFLTEILASIIIESLLTGVWKYLALAVVTIITNTIGMFAFIKYCAAVADGQDKADFLDKCVPFATKRFARIVIAQWCSAVIIFLFTLLLIIPGIIAAYNYSLVPFIMLEDKNINVSESLKRSRLLMYGHRWQMFCLGFRFFGWAILCIFTLGIGLLWLIPYATTACWHFYRSVIPSPESEEYQNLPPVSECKEISVALRIAVFILLVLFSALHHYNKDIKIKKAETQASKQQQTKQIQQQNH